MATAFFTNEFLHLHATKGSVKGFVLPVSTSSFMRNGALRRHIGAAGATYL